eukprot:NODE_26_length_40862_cov_0.679513.p8 type:complete len:618 gc:universal NODE_26_length_40862_cov_0.679513:32860-34713(+)
MLAILLFVIAKTFSDIKCYYHDLRKRSDTIDIERSDFMIELTVEALDGILNSRSSTLYIIEAYAPWCPHCQKFGPIISEVADKLHKEFKPQEIQMSRLNCDKFSGACDKLKVKGFPSVYSYYHGSKKAEFDGDREIGDPIYKWIHNQFTNIHERKETSAKADGSMFSKIYLESKIKKNTSTFPVKLEEVDKISQLGSDPWLLFNGKKPDILEKISARFNGLLRIGHGDLTGFAPKRKNGYFLFFLKTGNSQTLIPHDSHINTIDEIYLFGIKSLLLNYIYDPEALKKSGFEMDEISHEFNSIFFPFVEDIKEQNYMFLHLDLKTLSLENLLRILSALSEELDTYDFYPVGISVQRPTQGHRIKFYLSHDNVHANNYLQSEKMKKISNSESKDVQSFVLCNVKIPYKLGSEDYIRCMKEVDTEKIRSFVKHHKVFDISEITPLNVKSVFSAKTPQIVALVDPYLHTKFTSNLHGIVAKTRVESTETLKKIFTLDAWFFKEYVSTAFNIDFNEEKLPLVVLVKDGKYYRSDSNLKEYNDFEKAYDYFTTLIDKSGFHDFVDMHTKRTITTSSAFLSENIEKRPTNFYLVVLVVILIIAFALRYFTKSSYSLLPSHNKFA